MNTRVIAIVGACLLATSAAAQQKAADVTDAQIAEYKKIAENGCREAGVAKGDAPAAVEAFCGCVIETLTKNMTPKEWREVVAYSRNKQEAQERQALAPHLKNVGACQPE